MVTLLLTHKAGDARAAMQSLIESRGINLSEQDPSFPRELAALAWAIADAMAEEHISRAGGRRPKGNHK